ncbi:transposase [Trebonia sp.]|uniref:transposase n=2 Tax=Trebonia sp. TaxID=2767075 RepID=UPI00262D2C40|nr:transposase [Trebonia sp.]
MIVPACPAGDRSSAAAAVRRVPGPPCAARQYSGMLGKTVNCQVAVSVHLVSEHAWPAAGWRLFRPAGWDDAALALEMTGEMAGPGGWGVLEQATAAGGARHHPRRLPAVQPASNTRPARRCPIRDPTKYY